MSMTQEELDSAARGIHAAVFALLAAMELVETGDTLRAREYLDTANEDAQRALQLLVARGAWFHDAQRASDVWLHQLDTPATRALLGALARANEAAARVDRERGHVLPSGEGCGWSDAVGDVYHRLRLEVEGPRGGGRE